jgi:hypothetical protein
MRKLFIIIVMTTIILGLATGAAALKPEPMTGIDSTLGRDVPPPIPNDAISYYPSDGETGISTIGTLTWDYDGPPIIGYRVSLGSDYPPTNIASGMETCCCQLPLVNLVQPNTQYYWMIVPYNEFGQAVGCPVLTFHTAETMSGLEVPYWEPVDFGCLHNLPVGWLPFDGDGSGSTWEMTGDPGYTGAHSLHLSSNQRITVDDWMISPPLTMSQGIIYRFWTMVKAGQAACSNQLRVYFGNSPDPLDLLSSMDYAIWCINGTQYQAKTFDVSPPADGVYYFGIQGLGQELWSDVWIDDILVYDCAVPVDDAVLPAVAQPEIRSIYPNPFGSRVTIEYEMPKTDEVSLEIYNLRGQKICTVESGTKGSGLHRATFNLKEIAPGLPAGIYFCKLSTRDFIKLRRVVYTENER